MNHIASRRALAAVALLTGLGAHAQQCTGTAAVHSFKYNAGELTPEFDVVVKGCEKKRASTGRLQFTARGKDPGNLEQTLPGLDARWTSREGPKFTFSPAQTSQLQKGLISSVKQLTDLKVIECACVD